MPSTNKVVTLLTLHASFCIFWAVLACQPQDNWLNLQFTTIMSINEYCIIITVTTVTAFALQARTTREAQDPSALSRATLLLQAVTFLALALPWFRVQVPQTMREFFRGDYFVLEVWYPLVGWTCLNNTVIAIGQGVVLCFAFKKVGSGVEAMEKDKCC